MSLRQSVPVTSVVVLNWHNEDATAKCISSVKRWRSPTAIEIIIVDNQSTPQSRERLRVLEGCKIVPLRQNCGFAGGMNAGAQRSRGEFIALLNNDLLVAEDWLEAGLAVMTDPSAGIVGGKSYCWDDANPLGDVRNAAFTLPRVDPDRGFTQLLSIEAPQCRVAALDGSNLLIRKAAWTALGGFDEDYFAYFEDTDLCARALAVGWRAVYSPEMTVWHRRNLSSDRVRIRRTFWASRNRLYHVAKHFPTDRWLRMVVSISAEYLLLGLTGRSTLSRKRNRATETLTWGARCAYIIAAIWGITRLRLLRRKRMDVIRAGQHSEDYQQQLRVLYTPPPISPFLLETSP